MQKATESESLVEVRNSLSHLCESFDDIKRQNTWSDWSFRSWRPSSEKTCQNV